MHSIKLQLKTPHLAKRRYIHIQEVFRIPKLAGLEKKHI
jgi:hypothetical protein